MPRVPPCVLLLLPREPGLRPTGDPAEESLGRLTQGVLCHRPPAVLGALASHLQRSLGATRVGRHLGAGNSELGVQRPDSWAALLGMSHLQELLAALISLTPPRSALSCHLFGTREVSVALLTAAETDPVGITMRSRNGTRAGVTVKGANGLGSGRFPKVPGQRGERQRSAPHRAALPRSAEPEEHS